MAEPKGGLGSSENQGASHRAHPVALPAIGELLISCCDPGDGRLCDRDGDYIYVYIYGRLCERDGDNSTPNPNPNPNSIGRLVEGREGDYSTDEDEQGVAAEAYFTSVEATPNDPDPPPPCLNLG